MGGQLDSNQSISATEALTGLQALLAGWRDHIIEWAKTPQFYAQIGAIVIAWLLGIIIARQILRYIPWFSRPVESGRLLRLRQTAYSLRNLLRPVLVLLILAVAISFSDILVGSSWLVRLAQSLAVISLLYAVINRFILNPLLNMVARWIGLPAAAIWVFGYMPQVSDWLDGTAFEAGNVRLSLLTLIKTVLFGGALFWLGRISSSAGQRVIREQQSVDMQTRELAAKGFNLLVICFAGLLLFNLLGINLSVLAVFSGAVGVGLGFGLQQIASNFVSGVIILLERSLQVGDFLELEDGRTGTLKEINMRSSLLSTFDGKDIMVPNQSFITTRVVNWTHRDFRTRYEVTFTTAYDADLHKVPVIVQKAVAGVKGVLSYPEAPECLLRNFGASTCEFNVRFWIESIENANAYRSNVLYAIWDALKAADISMQAPAAPTVPLHILRDEIPMTKPRRVKK